MSDALLPLGSVAPDFSARASDGNRYVLSELLSRGHVVLVFYPANNTYG